MADADVSPPSASTATAPLFKKRTAKAAARKRPATPPPAQDSSDSSEEEYSSADDQGTGTRQIKRRRKGGVAAGQSAPTGARGTDLKATEFAASNTAHINEINDATRSSTWYEKEGPDELSAQALLGKSSFNKGQKEASDGTYRGNAAYTSHIQKSQAALERKSAVGPIKAPPSNIRTITVTDFAPDVCKDYKQTGFCGFGDSCKFLHAREDYAQGWQLDKEWEKVNTGKKVAGGKVVGRADRNLKGDAADAEEKEDVKLEGIPFACILCKESYKNPIITKCGHYFCEKCALERYRKNPSCAACGAGTNGVFNSAKGLKKLLERKREREALKEQEEKGDNHDD